MKFKIFALTALSFCSVLLFQRLAHADAPPTGYPLVKGVIKKLNVSSRRVSIKHEAIPNLNMPGMTMSFAAAELVSLENLNVNDSINFVADEVDGELTLLWLEKTGSAPQTGVPQTERTLLCEGIAPTHPRTHVEIEVSPQHQATIQYLFLEGLPGTRFTQSLGPMTASNEHGMTTLRTGVTQFDSILSFYDDHGAIRDAKFTYFSASMKDSPVTCKWNI